MLTEGLAIIVENFKTKTNSELYNKGTWNIIEYITLYAQIISLDHTILF